MIVFVFYQKTLLGSFGGEIPQRRERGEEEGRKRKRKKQEKEHKKVRREGGKRIYLLEIDLCDLFSR